MGVVSFRLPDDDERRLRALGIQPGAKAKELLEAELRRLRAERLAALNERIRSRSRVSYAALMKDLRAMREGDL